MGGERARAARYPGSRIVTCTLRLPIRLRGTDVPLRRDSGHQL